MSPTLKELAEHVEESLELLLEDLDWAANPHCPFTRDWLLAKLLEVRGAIATLSNEAAELVCLLEFEESVP